jgi:hypothetical protein
MNRTDDECYTGTGPAAEVANGWGKPCYSEAAAHAGQANQGQPTYAELLAQRDELVEVLTAICDQSDRWRDEKGIPRAETTELLYVRARAALSRIKGA